MKRMKHEVFGELEYNHSWWERKENIYFCGEKNEVTICVNGNENGEFEEVQKEAYNNFFSDVKNLLMDAEDSIYEYYQEVCEDYRERMGDGADESIPLISIKEEIRNLIRLNEVLFPWVFKKEIREVGLLLTCSWEPEHGLAVKFENEKIVEVGYQDIVL